MTQNPEEFIGVDVGAARVGIARGSNLARLAEPLSTVPAGQAVAAMQAVITKNKADGVVVGLPRSLAGDDTAQTKAVRAWANTAKQQIKLPFYWQDEALTSQLAENQDVKAGSDAAAAAIILQDFLDTPADQRVRC